MNQANSVSTTRFQAFLRFLLTLFGVNEVLFLAGFGFFFYGIARIWSIDWAFLASGCLLIAIALAGVIVSQRKGS
jgi:hypothetical protein